MGFSTRINLDNDFTINYIYIYILHGLIQQPSHTEPHAGAKIVSGGSGTAKRIFYKMCSGVPTWGRNLPPKSMFGIP
jgi:hypothetical protein